MKLHLIWTYTAKEIKNYPVKTLRYELKNIRAIAKYEKIVKKELKKRH
jgi:hypothetical protein